MSKEKRRVPRLRFPGFTGDWEQRKLSDILKVNSGKDYKHLDQGNIPVYGTGGYMLSVNEYLSNIDAIGIGRKGTIDKPQYLKAPFWTVDTLFYLTSLDKHSILFLYYLMQLIPWKKFDESTGVPSLSKTTIDNISGFVPSNSQEEELISALFNQLDKSITLHQRKLNHLVLKKKSLLQKLFPENGNRYPELRFPGFTDAWEQRKLDELVDVLDGDRGKNYPKAVDFEVQGHTLFLSASNVTNEGFSFKNNQYITKEKSDSMGNGRLVEDDVIITSRGSLGHVAWYNREIQRLMPHVRINSGMLILRKKVDISMSYLQQFIKSYKGQSQISFISFGSAQPQLTKKDVQKINIIYPVNLNEQIKIETYFSKLDDLITLHQRKLDHLQLQKKALLQQMFV